MYIPVAKSRPCERVRKWLGTACCCREWNVSICCGTLQEEVDGERKWSRDEGRKGEREGEEGRERERQVEREMMERGVGKDLSRERD